MSRSGETPSFSMPRITSTTPTTKNRKSSLKSIDILTGSKRNLTFQQGSKLHVLKNKIGAKSLAYSEPGFLSAVATPMLQKSVTGCNQKLKGLYWWLFVPFFGLNLLQDQNCDNKVSLVGIKDSDTSCRYSLFLFLVCFSIG